MVDQAEIHKMVQSENIKKHKIAVDQLKTNFVFFSNKAQAWQDLIRLTQDDDSDVRRGATDALGSAYSSIPDAYKDQAWQDLIRLTQDDDSDVQWRAASALGYAYSSIPDAYKDQAWQDLHRLTQDDDSCVRRSATDAVGTAFGSIPDAYKDQAWQDLHRLTQDDDSGVRWDAADALGSAYSSIPAAHKDQAWQDLIRLTQDGDSYVRSGAADALGSAYSSIPAAHKDQAWQDLIRLTQDGDSNVQWRAASAVGSAYSSISDASKDQAWQDLHRLTQDDDSDVRRNAASALGSAYSSIPNAHKDQAWQDLHRLTQDGDSNVQWRAASAVGSAFISIPAGSKDQAWQDLHRLTQDDDSDVRRNAAGALGSAFISIPAGSKDQAWQDLHRLTQDDDSDVRRNAAGALGSAFISIPAGSKDQAWQDLHRLTQDDDRQVRVLANYSLGGVSILNATEAVNENEFKNELKNALEFFEKSNAEATFINPANFCYPFYKSIYSITFEERNVETEVQEYLKEAKNAVEGSENKKTLLEAVENLGSALKEVHNLREKGLDACKSDLKTYKRHCDRACNILDIIEKDTPGAANIIRRGLPIIDQQIKEIITDIQEKAETLCKQTRDTPFEDSGKEVYKKGQDISLIRDPIGLEKSVNNFMTELYSICNKMPEEEGKEVSKLLKKSDSEQYIEDKLPHISIVLSKISSQIGRLKEMPKYQFENTKQVNIFEKSSTETSNNIEKLEKKLDEIMFSIKPGISEELVISIGAEFWGTGAQHVITIPLQEISYSNLQNDLERIRNRKMLNLASLPSRLADKIKDYLIQNKKDDLLKELE